MFNCFQNFRKRRLLLRPNDLCSNFTTPRGIGARSRVYESLSDLETHLCSCFRNYFDNCFEIIILHRMPVITHAVWISLTLTHDLDLDKVTKSQYFKIAISLLLLDRISWNSGCTYMLSYTIGICNKIASGLYVRDARYAYVFHTFITKMRQFLGTF